MPRSAGNLTYRTENEDRWRSQKRRLGPLLSEPHHIGSDTEVRQSPDSQQLFFTVLRWLVYEALHGVGFAYGVGAIRLDLSRSMADSIPLELG